MDDSEVQDARRIAERLDQLGAEIEGRLDPVVDALVPGTWAGRAADEARAEAREAAAELAGAARGLRELAVLVRDDAASAQSRAGLLGSGVVARGARSLAEGSA